MREKKVKIQLAVISDVLICCANMSNLDMVDHVIKIFMEEYTEKEQQVSFIVKTIKQQSSVNNINSILMLFESLLKYPRVSGDHSFYTVTLKSMFDHKKLNLVQKVIREIEKRMITPNTFMINTLLYGFGQKFDDILSVEHWIDYMNQNNITPNKYTYLTVANIYERMGYTQESKQYFDQYLSIENSSTTSSVNELIESGDLEKAESIIVESILKEKKLPTTFGAFIEHLCKQGMFLKAYHYFLFLPSKFKMDFDAYSVCNLMKSCPYYMLDHIFQISTKFPKNPHPKFFPVLFARSSLENDSNSCLIYFNQMIKHSIKITSKLFTSYLSALLVCDQQKHAKQFYESSQNLPFFSPKDLHYPDVIWADIFFQQNSSRLASFQHQQKHEMIQKSFSFLLETLCNSKQLSSVENLYQKMKSQKHPFKVREFVSLVKFCSSTKNISFLQVLESHIEKTHQKSSVLYAALVEAYCSVGEIEKAKKTFKEIAFFEEKKKINEKLVISSQTSIYNSFIKYFCDTKDEPNVTIWLQQAFEDDRVDSSTIFHVLKFFLSRNEKKDVEKCLNLLSFFVDKRYLDTLSLCPFIDMVDLDDNTSISFFFKVLIDHGFTSNKKIDDPLVKSLGRFISNPTSLELIQQIVNSYDINLNFNASEMKKLVDHIKTNF